MPEQKIIIQVDNGVAMVFFPESLGKIDELHREVSTIYIYELKKKLQEEYGLPVVVESEEGGWGKKILPGGGLL